jgi:hypothetical protein
MVFDNLKEVLVRAGKVTFRGPKIAGCGKLNTLPFCSDSLKWGIRCFSGYAESSPWIDLIKNRSPGK